MSDDDDIQYKRLCKGLSLSIAYAANTGGIATLTGTPPNMVFAGQAKTCVCTMVEGWLAGCWLAAG